MKKTRNLQPNLKLSNISELIQFFKWRNLEYSSRVENKKNKINYNCSYYGDPYSYDLFYSKSKGIN